MKLKILLPTKILVQEDIKKLSAEGANGGFGILPRHVDFVTAIVPCIFQFTKENGDEEYLAVDEGILVKKGDEVYFSTRNAVRGANLGELERTIKNEFLSLDERERNARSAAAKMEADLIRRFIEEERIT
ncbi:F0F1 ATP synthase subunit epsilon [candidate division KSB1 bacterium]|nr:F0F1 ATP synthase subunit epsilon [candidate division KSB1 bacterium]